MNVQSEISKLKNDWDSMSQPTKLIQIISILLGILTTLSGIDNVVFEFKSELIVVVNYYRPIFYPIIAFIFPYELHSWFKDFLMLWSVLAVNLSRSYVSHYTIVVKRKKEYREKFGIERKYSRSKKIKRVIGVALASLMNFSIFLLTPVFYYFLIENLLVNNFIKSAQLLLLSMLFSFFIYKLLLETTAENKEIKKLFVVNLCVIAIVSFVVVMVVEGLSKSQV